MPTNYNEAVVWESARGGIGSEWGRFRAGAQGRWPLGEGQWLLLGLKDKVSERGDAGSAKQDSAIADRNFSVIYSFGENSLQPRRAEARMSKASVSL